MPLWTNRIFVKDKNLAVVGQRGKWSRLSSEMPESSRKGGWGGRPFNIGQDPGQACHSSAGRSSVTVWSVSAYDIHIITR